MYPIDFILVVCLHMTSRLTTLCGPQIRGSLPGRAKEGS